jgi:hypothetical protein
MLCFNCFNSKLHFISHVIMNANDASCVWFAMLNACVTPRCYTLLGAIFLIDVLGDVACGWCLERWLCQTCHGSSNARAHGNVGSRGVSKVQCVEVASIMYSPHANASHCCVVEIRPLSLRGVLAPSLYFASMWAKSFILLCVLLQEKFGEFLKDELGVKRHGVVTTSKPRIYVSGTNC